MQSGRMGDSGDKSRLGDDKDSDEGVLAHKTSSAVQLPFLHFHTKAGE